MTDREPRTFFAIPAYGPIDADTAIAVAGLAHDEKALIRKQDISLLARNFNELWCAALNGRDELGLTHFAMLHADVAPPRGFLRKMREELAAADADLLSVVLPVKDESGRTSAALYDKATAEIRNLTEADLVGLPPTFDRSHFAGDQILLANTGLWICRLDRPWVEDCFFEIRDWVEKTPEGKFRPRTIPEDWNFSLKAHKAGAKICCTTTVRAIHFGRQGWELDLPEPAGAQA